MKSSRHFRLIEDYALLNAIEEWRNLDPDERCSIRDVYKRVAVVFSCEPHEIAARYLQLEDRLSPAFRRMRTIESKIQIVKWRGAAKIEKQANEYLEEFNCKLRDLDKKITKAIVMVNFKAVLKERGIEFKELEGDMIEIIGQESCLIDNAAVSL